MPKVADIIGQRFGRLLVLSRAGWRNDGAALWLCKCDCGNTTVTRPQRTKSCGCLKRENILKVDNTTHGHSRKPEYQTWKNMIRRCEDRRDTAYERYGGRGIFVSPEWKNLETFLNDMGPRPSASHSLERLDNNGPYSKENCVWSPTKADQARNRRSTRFLEFRGMRMCVKDWADYIGMNPLSLRSRLADNWPIERALTEGTTVWNQDPTK